MYQKTHGKSWNDDFNYQSDTIDGGWPRFFLSNKLKTPSQAIIAVSFTATPGAMFPTCSGLPPGGLALPGSEFQELEDVERFAGSILRGWKHQAVLIKFLVTGHRMVKSGDFSSLW